MNLNPATAVQSAFHNALQHHQAGRLGDAAQLYRQILQAVPRHADALHLLGVVALQRGEFKSASDLIQQAIDVRPADNYFCNLGNALKEQGRLDDAIAAYRQALALNGHMVEALCNLGDALLQHGNADEAVSSCRQAIALRPDFAAAHCNLGNALMKQGHVDMAVASYRQALRISPGLAIAHGNLGDALASQGLYQQALEAYGQALRTGLDTTALHRKMAGAQAQLGQWDLAIASALQALQRSDSNAIRTEFVQWIKAVQFLAPHAEVRAQVLRALQEVWADPGDLLTPATSLIESNPAVQAGMARVRRAEKLDDALLAEMAGDQLLLCLLETDTVNSMTLERLLTAVRRQMLHAAVSRAERNSVWDATANLHGAIARQCFINEYVYACSDGELQQLGQLQARLNICLAEGTLPDASWLVASAAYAPLSALAAARAWAAMPWPAPLAALFTQQVIEPDIERQYRAGMPRLTAIDDAVSRLVQAQYEEHPYPRWVRAPRIAAPSSVDEMLRRQFPAATFQPLGTGGPLEVLVAGCGTGQHPMQVAQQFQNAQVLAIDLSVSSLSYAQRKTAEFGLTNIEYAQADILQLGTLEQRFDLIESAGVLHHLADPAAGWRVLLGLLRPGGLMCLGFYSELGRQDVVAARRRIAEQGLAANATDIRRCRQELMRDEVAPQFENFLSSRDFYSTSACRDLLFHVQEHRYTLPQLKDMLAQLGLHFIGFVLDREITARYDRQFPDDRARTNLDHWHAFETASPQTFARMYQFWVQKPR